MEGKGFYKISTQIEVQQFIQKKAHFFQGENKSQQSITVNELMKSMDIINIFVVVTSGINLEIFSPSLRLHNKRLG